MICFETVLFGSELLLTEPYKVHQFVKEQTDHVFKKKGIFTQSVAVGMSGASILTIRTNEKLCDSSVKLDFDSRIGQAKTIVVDLCINQSKSRNGSSLGLARNNQEMSLWLNTLLERIGVEGEASVVPQSRARRSVKPDSSTKEANAYIVIAKVLMTGVIFDSAKYETAMQEGIGKKRSWGLGMLVEIPNEEV
jgi:hypothetical protein